jgi:hypothetical protein
LIPHKKWMIFKYYYHCLIDNKRLRMHLLSHLYRKYHTQYECASQWLSVTKKSKMLRLNRRLGRQGAKDRAVFVQWICWSNTVQQVTW